MVTITLPPDLEHTISEKARLQGTSVELLTLDVLNREFMSYPNQPPPEGSLADYLGDFIGCIDSGEIVPGGA